MAVACASAPALIYVLALGTAAPLEAQVNRGATVTILAAPVEVGRGDSFAPATDGQTLQIGDELRTGPSGLALLTFFDGSESQIGADSQLRVDAGASGGSVSLAQLAGTTINHVQKGSQGGYQVTTSAQVGLVRGTTFVVTVQRMMLVSDLYPRFVGGDTNRLLGEQTARVGVNLIQTRSWEDPTTGRRFETRQDLGPYHIVEEARYADHGRIVRVRRWLDPQTSASWDTFDDFGDEVQPGAGTRLCVGQDPRCLTSTMLLADPDGSVGRVELSPTALLQPRVDLAATCSVGGASTEASTQGLILGGPCAELQAAVTNLRNPEQTRRVRDQSVDLTREVALAMGMNVFPRPPNAAPVLGPQTLVHTRDRLLLAGAATMGSLLLVYAAGKLIGRNVDGRSRLRRQEQLQRLSQLGDPDQWKDRT